MFRFLCIPNLFLSKGILVLLDACTLLKSQDVCYQIHFVGSDSAEISTDRFRREISARDLQNHVVYHHCLYGPDKEARLDEADAFILPTLNDCFPLVILEAMRHGLPAISTPVGAIPDLIVNGESGLIVPEKSSRKLAKAMKYLACHPDAARTMGAMAQKRYLQYFTRCIFEKKLFHIIKKISEI